MEYFKNLEELLTIEKKEDQLQYDLLVKGASINEKKEKGLLWYPLVIKNTEFTKGDYINVEFERPTCQHLSHSFKFGSPVSFFSNHDASIDKINGIVNHVNGNKIKIYFRTEELPDWARDGKLGIELLFDSISYNEMFNALKQAQNLENEDLIEILLGQKKASFNENLTYQPIIKLNESQNNAVKNILVANNLAIVHGPPGTGKTTTIIEAILKTIPFGKILVVAPSNAAIDLITEKLVQNNVKVISYGNSQKVSNMNSEVTLDAQISLHPLNKEIKKLRKQASEYKNMAHKYKRNFGKAEAEQRKALFDEAHKIMKEVELSEKYIIDDLIKKTEVITATLVGSNQYWLKNLQFHAVFIDEAGQALEPACWIPILKADKIIFAGDFQQLPPTIKSQKAAQLGLNKTLFEKLVEMQKEAVTMLDIQYRMNEKIMRFSSKTFYNNELNADESVKNHHIDGQPITFIDTAGCGFEEKLVGTSSTNPEEAEFLLQRMMEFCKLNYYKKTNFL